MTQTVAIYAHYSSDQQRDASIEDQVRVCRVRADREGGPLSMRFDKQSRESRPSRYRRYPRILPGFIATVSTTWPRAWPEKTRPNAGNASAI
jgi:hypothetical protein